MKKDFLFGFLAGDIIGSSFESNEEKPDFVLRSMLSKESKFTDDSILTLATSHILTTYSNVNSNIISNIYRTNGNNFLLSIALAVQQCYCRTFRVTRNVIASKLGEFNSSNY
jgi:hypothetical protein